MGRHDDLLGLVDDIYQAASETEHWPHVWARLCRLMDCSSAGILSTALPIRSAAVFTGMTDAEAAARYNGYYGSQDPWFAASKRHGLQPGSQTLAGDRLVPRSALVRTEFYADFGRHYDIVRPLTTVHQRTPSDVFALTVVRSERSPEWDLEDASFVRVLEPHVRRALQVHYHLDEAGRRTHVLEDALDALAVGVACLDAAGKAVFANAAARRCAGAQDGLAFEGGTLTSPAPAARVALQRALATVLETGPARSQAPPATVLVPRPSGRPAYRVEVVRTGRGEGARDRGWYGGAMLFISDPAALPVARTSRLAIEHGLTDAEAAVAVAIASGASLEVIAEERGVSVQTVRTQLKQVFNKTGTRRQSALAALVNRLASPLRDG